MYAIIATGGKQYKVAEGDVLKVEKLSKPVRRCRNISRDCLISYKLQNLLRRARILLYCEWHV